MIVALVIAMAVAGCTSGRSSGDDASSPAVATELAPPQTLARTGVGGGTLLLASDDRELRRSMEAMNDLGVNLLRLDIPWPLVEPARGVWNWAPVDRVVDSAERHGIEVVGIIDYTPTWDSKQGDQFSQRPSSPAAYGRYAGQVARHFGGRVTTYEIWNEPNGGFFFRPGPDPEFYTRMLRSAYRAIKSASPRSVVLGGSVATAVDSDTTMNGLTFLERVYAAGGGPFMDAVSIHPYSYPQSYAFDPGNPVSAMRMAADMYDVMRRHGDGGKRIWATEVGFPASGASSTDERRQADLLVSSVREWSQLSFAGPIMIHELRDRAEAAGDRENTFGLIDFDFSRKSAFTALKALVADGVDDDTTYRRIVAAASASSVDLGGRVTPWYRDVSSRGVPSIRQEFVNGDVICTGGECFASPGPVMELLDKQGHLPAGAFENGHQKVGAVVQTEVFYSPRTGAHLLSGDMLGAWRPEYGLPMSDERSDSSGTVVRCERATLRVSRGGTVRVESA